MLSCTSPIIQLFKFRNKSDIRNENNDKNFSKYGIIIIIIIIDMTSRDHQK